MSSKRKKNDSSDEESDEIDWRTECRKMDKEFFEKIEQLEELNKEHYTKDKELLEMAEKNGWLESQLKRANGKLLGSQSMLSAKGVIEWLEREQRMPDSIRRGDRHDRWKWIFDNDTTFCDELRSYLPRSTAQRGLSWKWYFYTTNHNKRNG